MIIRGFSIFSLFFVIIISKICKKNGKNSKKEYNMAALIPSLKKREVYGSMEIQKRKEAGGKIDSDGTDRPEASGRFTTS